MEIEKLYNLFLQSAGVNTDTRTIAENQLFFALKGENFDGNAFAMKALEAGACAAVVNRTVKEEDPRLIKVEDTLEALKALAAYHRSQLDIPVIGLTGTNGKTTTKELISAVLRAKYNVVATVGNLNNEIGVPLSVLKIGRDAHIAVIEMGASHPEDLKPLLAVSQPSHGLITNVGKAHLEGFGSYEGVMHAKGLLYDYLKENDGIAFANADDPVLQGMLWDREMTYIAYGLDGVEVLPSSAGNPFLRMKRADGRTLETHLVGAYNATNVLAALKIGWFFGVPEGDAVKAVESYVPSNNRSQLVRTQRNTLIVDAYNANPSSMAVALDNLALCEGRRVALLGDMRELGADSAAEHKKIVDRLNGSEAILVGTEFKKAAEGTGIPVFDTSDALAEWLKANPITGCTVLVKGSRGIRMEKVIDSL
ncbi:MAG: UDP-N-acetylmuramoyl-tripeptide--D-alanyl-D-alanine ligase [Bacteroidales bacterium]|nr:UDP-N-acetylmuramoyl-tripeptide--D-alanyl-D-alanine ligase [Bacteroidales bacterium]